MLTKQIIQKMNPKDRSLIRDGASVTFLFMSAISYWNYRERIRKEFMRSGAHYKFNSTIQNITPWKQLYWTWHRMPKEQYDVYHRFKPYYLLGQLDYSKEILIPKKKGNVDGYEVINPLYCYEGGRVSFKNMF